MQTMTIPDKQYNILSTDFRVETVAANLLKYYDANASLFIRRVGTNDRPYLKDIKRIYNGHHLLDEEAVIMETYRESLYDYLPEGLFHSPSLGHAGHQVDSVVREMRRQKQVEEHARRFFQPFELEFFYTEIMALLRETEFDIRDKSDVLIDTLAELWPLLTKVDRGTAKIFFYILPFLHEVRGNRRWIERFLTAFLQVPVRIDFVPNTITASDDTAGLARLGNTRLGLTLIPNGAHQDGVRNWQVNIVPIPFPKIPNYVKGLLFRELLLEIYEYVMPVSVKIETRFITENSPESFVLPPRAGARLGFSTFI